MKEAFLALIVFLSILLGIYFFLDKLDKKRCGGVYPNPEIGGCGIYSESDISKIKCEKAGGIMIYGTFSANCVFKPLNNNK